MVESRMGVDNGSRREKIDLLVNGGTREEMLGGEEL